MTAECKRISPDHIGPDCSCTGAACALDITETYDGEFEPLIDRDPGDETAAVPVPVSRSYRATYSSPNGNRSSFGTHTLIFRDLIGPDSFLTAVEMAENMREEGERLLNVSELT